MSNIILDQLIHSAHATTISDDKQNKEKYGFYLSVVWTITLIDFTPEIGEQAKHRRTHEQ